MGAVRICSLSSSLQGDVNKFIERDIGVGRFRIMGVGVFIIFSLTRRCQQIHRTRHRRRKV